MTWEPGDKVLVHGLDLAFVVADWLAPDLVKLFVEGESADGRHYVIHARPWALVPNDHKTSVAEGWLQGKESLVRTPGNDRDTVLELCYLLDCAPSAVIQRINAMQYLTNFFCDRPGDRLYHAADDTWWRREGDQLVRAEPPPGWTQRGSEPWLGEAP